MANQTFFELWNELKGEIPALSPFAAQRFVKRAYDEILNSRRWSFLIAEGYLYAPVLINTGTVTVTQFSLTVLADAVAKAVLDAVGIPGSGISLAKRQFRLPGKPIYNISAYDSVTGTITLDRIYMEASAAGAGYEVYRCYYTPPAYNGTDIDFLRWVAVVDPITGYKIRGKNLAITRAELDRKDPQRTSYENPIQVCAHHGDSDGNPVFELWPHPRTERVYTAPYQRRGTTFSAAGDFSPGAIHDHCIMDGARLKAYVWASANAGRFEELQGTNWLQLKNSLEKDYQADLRRMQVLDEETFLQTWSVFDGDDATPFPIDSNWLQAHDPGPNW